MPSPTAPQLCCRFDGWSLAAVTPRPVAAARWTLTPMPRPAGGSGRLPCRWRARPCGYRSADILLPSSGTCSTQTAARPAPVSAGSPAAATIDSLACPPRSSAPNVAPAAARERMSALAGVQHGPGVRRRRARDMHRFSPAALHLRPRPRVRPPRASVGARHLRSDLSPCPPTGRRCPPVQLRPQRRPPDVRMAGRAVPALSPE